MPNEPQTQAVGATPASSETPTQLAVIIQSYLDREGISAYQLAKRSNISPQTVINILNSQYTPQSGTLAALAHATSIPLETLRTAAGKDRAEQERERARLYRANPRLLNALYDDMAERIDDLNLDEANRERLLEAIEQARSERVERVQPTGDGG